MTTSNAPSTAARIAAVRTRYDAAHAALRRSEAEEMLALRAECAKEGHQWKLSQVAGDGRICLACGEHDGSDD